MFLSLSTSFHLSYCLYTNTWWEGILSFDATHLVMAFTIQSAPKGMYVESFPTWSIKSKLMTDNFSIRASPKVVTHRSPLTIDAHFDTPLRAVTPSHQPHIAMVTMRRNYDNRKYIVNKRARKVKSTFSALGYVHKAIIAYSELYTTYPLSERILPSTLCALGFSWKNEF